MRYGEGSGIGEVTVDKRQLIDVLRKNRDAHRDVFQRAVTIFREKAVAELNKLVDEITEGKLPRHLAIGLPVPEEHTGDYDRAIQMLLMHVSDTITLSEQAYAQLVDDDWGWKEVFTGTTMHYIEGGS